MSLKSFLKALIPFSRGDATNSTGVPFFGSQNFNLWDSFHTDFGSKIN